MTPGDGGAVVRKGGGALGVLGAAAAAAARPLRPRGGRWRALAVGLAGGRNRRGTRSPAAFRAAGWARGRGRISTARSAMIEMRLDHDTGAMSGSVLAGPFQGRALDTLSRPDASPLRRACRRDDPEGASLLETYLDRRFAGWREADEGQGEARGRAGRGGAMSRDEAYEILGLPKGADARGNHPRAPFA